MKKTVLALVVAAATSVALSAQAPAATTSHKKETSSSMKSVQAKAKARVETAEVVSADAAAKSITVKPATGDNQTYTATGAAVSQLAKVKAGDHVRLTVRDNDVTRISMAGTMHATSAKKSAPKKNPAK